MRIAWEAANREKLNARMRDYRKLHPEKVKAANLSRYGISLEEFLAMSEAQNHACAICKKQKALCVDHCHKTGKVRELLCHGCNKVLGHSDECQKTLRESARYLKRHE